MTDQTAVCATRLVERLRMDTDEILECCILGDTAPGICTQEDCSWVDTVMPDTKDGVCLGCGHHTVVSIMVLWGLMD